MDAQKRKAARLTIADSRFTIHVPHSSLPSRHLRQHHQPGSFLFPSYRNMPIGDHKIRHWYADIIPEHLLQYIFGKFYLRGLAFHHQPGLMLAVIHKNVEPLFELMQPDLFFNGNVGSGITKCSGQVMNKVLSYPFLFCQQQPDLPVAIKNVAAAFLQFCAELRFRKADSDHASNLMIKFVV